MSIRLKPQTWFVFVLMAILTISCQSKLEEYYKPPEWLKGNAREVLEAEGNYDLFLEAVEKSGFTDVISGKGIITVFAPTDEAFNAYLSNSGYGSIDAIPDEELSKLVGFHLVYYSFGKDDLANYWPYGVTDDMDESVAGLHYKFRTKSSSPIEEVNDKTLAAGFADSIKKVYHKERFLPVLSSYIFDTKSIDAKANYEYFYPNSEWTGQDGGFNVSNASVEDYAIVADNGYVYTIDQVLEPLETIYTELDESENYSMFRSMYDRFMDLQLDQTATENYGNGEDLYLYYHTDLPKIASEWSYNGEGSLPDYADLEALSKDANNVFAPVNASVSSFYNQFWGPYYSSMDSIGFIPVKYLLDNHVYEGDIIFPDEIANGEVETPFGTVIDFNTSDVSLKKICTNGTLYGINNLMIPPMFESVTFPAFQQPQFRVFLQMLDYTDLVIPLMSDDKDFKLFLPNDHVILDNTTVEGKRLLYQNLNPHKYGQQSIQIEGDDEPWVPMKRNTMSIFVNNHVATDLVTTYNSGSIKVYKTLNSYQYLMVENETNVYSTYIYNNYKDAPSPAEFIGDAYNGEAYELNGETEYALIPDNSLFKEQLSANTPEGMAYFKEVVVAAQFTTSSPPFDFLLGEKFIVFVPSDDAILNNFSEIPFDNPANTAEYLKYYFVSISENGLNDYPFPGAGIEGTMTTYKMVDGENTTLTITDTGDGLTVTDGKGRTVNVISTFPNIYADGAAYIIDGLLSNE